MPENDSLTGYTCKTCGGPAPLGVGFATTATGAYWSSVGRSNCDCGASEVQD